MAKIFLDANVFIDIVQGRVLASSYKLFDSDLYVSASSLGIWTYAYKIKVPNTQFIDIFESFNFINLDVNLMKLSVEGPTSDYEDNIQLHSASINNCDEFLTKDNSLLKIKHYRNIPIRNPAPT